MIQIRHALLVFVGLLVLPAAASRWSCSTRLHAAEPASSNDISPRDRSPVDLALAPSGEWVLTANQTSDSVSLLDIRSGRVLDELVIGPYPAEIVLTRDGRHALVTCRDAGQLAVIEIGDGQLRMVRRVTTGGLPYGVALGGETTAYVALGGLDQVVVVDWRKGAVERRMGTGRWPRYLAVSADGTRLAVGTSGDRGISVLDPRSGELLYVERFVGLNIGHLHMSADDTQVYFPWMVYRRNSITPGNIRLGWVLASRIARVRLDGPSRREGLSLDPPGRAVADPFGIDLTRDEQYLVVSAAGTHELLILRASDLPYKDHGGTDHIDPELLADVDRFSRVELGGRPMGLEIAPDDRTVYVANYLDNSVQVVDLVDRRLVRTLSLGGPAVPSLARRGEAIFHDARRSLDQWYSCATCHYEGGTNAVAMDTDNDGTAFTFKSVLPLYHLSDTAPWTWHGWQQDLRAAMRKSLTSTMLGPQPNDDDVEAVLAYLATLQPPPNPHRPAGDGDDDSALRDQIERGRQVFTSKSAGCSDCHQGPYFTDGRIHDIGLGGPRDRYEGFNTPTLIGVWQKVTLLHDARAASLEEVLTGDHDPAKVHGTRSLTAEELRDLVAYLRSL